MDNKETFFVDPYWVKDQLGEDKNLVILDAPYGKNEYVKEHDTEKREYESKHIPGAIKIDKSEISGVDSDLNLYSPETIRDVFLSKGITSDTTLVVYSDGVIAASRVAFTAYWLGVKQVKILNGGLYAWEEAGFEFESGSNEPISKRDFGAEVPGRPDILVPTPLDLKQAKENNPDLVLACIRSWEEFVGGKSGYPYIQGEGSIPGSVFAKASTHRTNTNDLVDDQGNVGDLDLIFEEWSGWGITSDKEVIFYCGAGWRAATAFFIAKEKGWKNIKVFDGGWYQWNKYHQENPDEYPIQIGNPKNKDGCRIIAGS